MHTLPLVEQRSTTVTVSFKIFIAQIRRIYRSLPYHRCSGQCFGSFYSPFFSTPVILLAYIECTNTAAPRPANRLGYIMHVIRIVFCMYNPLFASFMERLTTLNVCTTILNSSLWFEFSFHVLGRMLGTSTSGTVGTFYNKSRPITVWAGAVTLCCRAAFLERSVGLSSSSWI